jgi:23S rRNA (guanosine2251-2'-O)-methyltransferase
MPFYHNKTNKSNPPSNLIYGLRPVIEALKAGKEFDRILLQRDARNEQLRELITLARDAEVVVQQVPAEKLDRLTRSNHQGVVAFIAMVTYQPIENILMGAFEKGKSPLLVILDRVTDVRNMGAIARTAECAGADAIIVPSRGGAQVNADAIKTSAGALNTIPVHRSDNLKDTIGYLKQSGLKIIAASEHADSEYYDADFAQPVALIMGSEEDGVSPEYLKLADLKVKIPLLGNISSLNVSVAAGILLFEAVKQRMTK